MNGYAAIVAEYAAAREAVAAAESRLRAAGAACMAAQCGVLFAKISDGVRVTHHHCTLASGHEEQAHRNASRTEAADSVGILASR